MIKLRRKLATLLVMSIVGSNTGTLFAQDYAEHWASKTIAKWNDKGLLKGYEDGTFKPDNAITRAEFAVILVRMFGYKNNEEPMVFQDVKEDAWYTQAISAVTSADIMYLDSNSFRPNDVITREEASYALAKAYSITGEDKNVEFIDEASISEWASKQVEAMHSNGFIEGNSMGAFEAKKSLTRAEFLTMADRMTSDIISTAGTYTNDVVGNLIVNTKDVILKDMVIEGNLYLGEGIGDGDVSLEGIEVKGKVFVDGGGENSIKSKYSKFYDRIVVSASNPVRVVINGDAVKVEAMPDTEVILTGKFEDVIVAPNVNMTIKEAIVEKIIVAPGSSNAKTATILLDKLSKVDMIQADTAVNIKGEAEVKNLLVNAKGVTVEKLPQNVTIKNDDMTFNLDGKTIDKDEVKELIKPSTSGGGSGGGGSSSGSSSGNTKPPMQEKYLISGTVSYEGENVEHARVNVFKINADGEKKYIEGINTDENGYYSFYVASDERYWVEAWMDDDEGYGYHARCSGENYKGIHIVEDTTINFELQKKYVVNFKVTDKNGVALNDVKIQAYSDGKKNGYSTTDAYGTTMLYMWDTDADYTFELSYDGEIIYKDPTVYKVSETFKLDIPIKVEELGLNNVVEGRIIDGKTKKPVEGVNVGLFKVDVTGPHDNHSKRVDDIFTDKEGKFTFKIDDLESIYVVSGRLEKPDETGQINYYETIGTDPRFIDTSNNSLEMFQCYGITIKTIDKNGKPLQNIKVGTKSEHCGHMTRHTNDRGEGALYDFRTQPGKFIVWAEMEINGKIRQQIYPLDMVEGKYNYSHTFQFDVENNNRLAEITVKNPEVKVGDKILKAYEVQVRNTRDAEVEWARFHVIKNGIVTISIPEKFKDEKVRIVVKDKEGISLYSEEVDFRGSELKKTIDLSTIPSYKANIEFDITSDSALKIDGEIDVKLEMRGWWGEHTTTLIDEVSKNTEGITFNNLIESEYSIRAEYTTQGNLYISTWHINQDYFGQGDLDIKMNLQPATEFTLEFVDEYGEKIANRQVIVQSINDAGRTLHLSYVTDSQGKVKIVEGLKKDSKIYIEAVRKSGNGTYNNKIIKNRSIKPGNGEEYTVMVETTDYEDLE